MTKKSEQKILEEDLGIDLNPVSGEEGQKCASIDELDLFGGNNTQDPNSIFNPKGKENQGFLDGKVIEKSVEKNRFIGTLVQSSRTEMKYNHKTEEILNNGDRSVIFSDLEYVEEGDKVRIIDDRGFGVTRYIKSIDKSTKRVTFSNLIEVIESQYGDSEKKSDYISKGADIYFIRRRIPWIDRDENIRSSALLKLINRSVQTFTGEAGTTENNNGFEIQSVAESPIFETNIENNFVISKGTRPNDNRLQEAGRYYINGIPAMIPDDVLFVPNNDQQFHNSKKIMPETTNTKQLDSVEAKIIDKNASFPVDNLGNGMLSGKTLLLGFPDEQDYEIIDNNKTEIFVKTKGRANVDEITTSGKTYYRIKPQQPESDQRTDSVFLNMYFDVIDQYDDPDIYAMNEGQQKTHSQNRLKIKQRIELREGEEPDINYNGTDQEGLQHLVTKIGEINRRGQFITENQKVDKRNIFRSLGKIGLQNILMNPSFEFTDDNTQNNETIFTDWFLFNPNNINVSFEEYKNDDFSQESIDSENLEQSAKLNIEENFDNDLLFTQVYEDTNLNNSLFQGRNLTFSINAKPLNETTAIIEPYVKVETTSTTSLIKGDTHSGENNWQRLTAFTQISDNDDIERIEIGLNISGNNSDSTSILFDQGTLVYGIFPSGVNFFDNQLLNEISILKDEIHDARRSSQRSTNFDSVDFRIDGYEEEVIKARESDTLGSFPSVRERNNEVENRLQNDHNAKEQLNNDEVIMHPFFGSYTNNSQYIPVFDTGKTTNNMNTTIKFDHNSRFTLDDIRNQDLSKNSDGEIVLNSPFNIYKENLKKDNKNCIMVSPWGVKVDIIASLHAKPGGLFDDDEEDKLEVNDLYMEDGLNYRWFDLQFSKGKNASGNFFDQISASFANSDLLEIVTFGVLTAGVGAVVLGLSGTFFEFNVGGSSGNHAWPEKDGVSGSRDKFRDLQCIDTSHPKSPSQIFNRDYNLKVENNNGTTIHADIDLNNDTGKAFYRVIISFVHLKPINLFGK